MVNPDGGHRGLVAGRQLGTGLVLEAVEHQVSQTQIKHLPRSFPCKMEAINSHITLTDGTHRFSFSFCLSRSMISS